MSDTGFWGWTQEPEVTRAMELGASQEPMELGMAARMLAAMPARVIVEIGCDRGGTLYMWRQITRQVFGITLADNSFGKGGSGLPLDSHGATVHIGDSHDPVSRGWLICQLEIDQDQPIMDMPLVAMAVEHAGLRHAIVPIDALVIDGDHSEAGVLADVADYGPLVRPGGVILLHDIRTDDPGRVQVPQAWAHLVQVHETTQLLNPEGGQGWGVIHVREHETYQRSAP